MVKHGSANKAHVNVFADKFTLKCKDFTIISEGLPATTKILINGKQVAGCFFVRVNCNTKRPVEIEMGIFPGWFQCDGLVKVEEVKTQTGTKE